MTLRREDERIIPFRVDVGGEPGTRKEGVGERPMAKERNAGNILRRKRGG